MLEFLIRLALMVLTLLVVVPAVTGGGVAVRQGGFFRGLLSLIVIGLVNLCLWFGITLATLGAVVPLQILTFGLVGLLINALAFKATSAVMPEVLYVKSFGTAFGASLVMTIATWAINHFLF